jgi:hypothetical protein
MVPREVEGVTAAALALLLLAGPAAGAADDASSRECNGLWLATRSLSEQGDHAAGDEKSRLLERAIGMGEEAVRRCPDTAEAHFWLGASYGRLAEAKGGLTALRMVGHIRSPTTTGATPTWRSASSTSRFPASSGEAASAAWRGSRRA